MNKTVLVTIKEETTRYVKKRVSLSKLAKFLHDHEGRIVGFGRKAQARAAAAQAAKTGQIRVGKPPQYKAKKGKTLRAGSINEGVYKMFKAAPTKRFTAKEIEAKLKQLKSKSIPSAICNNICQTLPGAIKRDPDTGTWRLVA